MPEIRLAIFANLQICVLLLIVWCCTKVKYRLWDLYHKNLELLQICTLLLILRCCTNGKYRLSGLSHKNVELLWNRPESLLLKMLSYCGTGILPAAKNLVDKTNN